MSVVEKAVREAGLNMRADTLDKKQRTVKCFQRLIAALRAAEAEVDDRISASERELNESLRQNLELQERNRVLEMKLLQHNLQERLNQIPALTVADKAKLLELQPTNGK